MGRFSIFYYYLRIKKRPLFLTTLVSIVILSTLTHIKKLLEILSLISVFPIEIIAIVLKDSIIAAALLSFFKNSYCLNINCCACRNLRLIWLGNFGLLLFHFETKILLIGTTAKLVAYRMRLFEIILAYNHFFHLKKLVFVYLDNF